MRDLDQIQTLEYRWYVLAYQQYGLPVLEQPEFSAQYARYQRCERLVREYEAKQTDPEFWRQQGPPEERLRVRQMVNNIAREKYRLSVLHTAVLQGMSIDGYEGGAGVGAELAPIVPPRQGADAKAVPLPDSPAPEFADFVS